MQSRRDGKLCNGLDRLTDEHKYKRREEQIHTEKDRDRNRDRDGGRDTRTQTMTQTHKNSKREGRVIVTKRECTREMEREV